MCGDTPFLSGEVIANAYRQHKAQHNAVTIVTATLENPFGYGRIVRDEDRILRIVEEKDANDAEKAIKEIIEKGKTPIVVGRNRTLY